MKHTPHQQTRSTVHPNSLLKRNPFITQFENNEPRTIALIASQIQTVSVKSIENMEADTDETNALPTAKRREKVYPEIQNRKRNKMPKVRTGCKKCRYGPLLTFEGLFSADHELQNTTCQV
jgi:hypothetical protein